ncbi:hypothetical protein EDL99_08440 [Ornithobacterium rhinotracheale]|uniref:hypothetical protein n=1 Tax=Ornithobacterium rhinotracheale TaxID=28251 RepID=UPI00129CB088|nr:hypothetical protein [Ornithobacterium rhinotracheale]MRJ08890.1 hypothetical protein [Ornithobacterium rhinotracheale]UOH77773.1 hypothetical protein MT996_11290 [Ornithobacterium rhinotracheale]
MNEYDSYQPFNLVEGMLNFDLVAYEFREITPEGVLSNSCRAFITFSQQKKRVLVEFKDGLDFSKYIRSILSFDIAYTSNDRVYCATIPEKTNINKSIDFLRFKNNFPTWFNGVTREFMDFGYLDPYVCSIFTKNQQVKKIAFRFENPVRILEFYILEYY